MRLQLKLFICFICSVVIADGKPNPKKNFTTDNQAWGHVDVRPGAHMFWWLYYTTANVTSFYEKPLIIWLQGGPTTSSSYSGNFNEIGPLDTNFNERNATWVQKYNVLYIDSPVGVGFSYVDSKEKYVKNNSEIASDLLKCIQGFLQTFPRFSNVSTYIMSESYGGKMAVEFAHLWYKEQNAGNIISKLKGVGLGNPFITPIDSALSYAEFLETLGHIDSNDSEKINMTAQGAKIAIEKGDWRQAAILLRETERIVKNVTFNVNFNSVLYEHRRNSTKNTTITENNLMNNIVKSALGLQVSYAENLRLVVNYLAEDIMKPVDHIVEKLLNETNLRVFIYSGQFDLTVPTPGTLRWVNRLKWDGADAWKKSERRPIVGKRLVRGFVKSYGKFGFYWAEKSGHMVPVDNPVVMAKILKDMTNEA